MREFQIEHVALPQLAAQQRNTRTHSKKQMHQIAASIREFGFNSPLLVDEHGVILIGNGRYQAAKLLGLHDRAGAPARPSHRQAEGAPMPPPTTASRSTRAGIDEMLAATFKELDLKDLSFDPEITGFDTAEIDKLIDRPDARSQVRPRRPDPAA